jgi:hypothetical protein
MPPPYIVDHNFSSVDRVVEPIRVNGTEPHPTLVGYYYEYQDFNPANRTQSTYAPTCAGPNWALWKTKALANMNPNKPVVDLPLFLFEFKDFPRMLRDLGRILLKKRPKVADIPGQYLAYSFGWAPLIADLMELFDLSKAIEDRKAYLLRLERGTKLRRTLESGTLSDVWTSNGFGTSGITWDTRLIETRKVWFTANAKLLTPLPAADRLQGLSQDLVLGLRISPATFWNMIPWSWLIDYFVNVGTFMEAQQGQVKTSCTRMNIMADSKISNELHNARPNASQTHSGGLMYSTQRLRQIYSNPTPTLSFEPFLTNRELGNLGALITAKALKG